MSVRAINLLGSVKYPSVIGHAGEVEHHLIDFRIAVAAHCDDAVRQWVEHLCDLCRRIFIGKRVARPVIQNIAQQHQLVGGELVDNAERFGFDTGHVFGVGDSAGAHLLSLFCCLCTNPDYAAQYPFRAPAGFAPTAVALNCGVYEIRIESKKDHTARLMADLLPDKGTDEELRRISPIRHVTDKFPPAVIMTAEGDFLAQAAPPMVRKLESLGVPVVYRYYGDRDHVLGHVFHCNMYSADAAQCNRDECDFFRGFC